MHALTSSAMASTGRIAYAERLRDYTSGDNDIRRSSPVGSATAKFSDEPPRSTDLEQKAFQEQTERLLKCPCLKDLREGPCGDSFKDAFKCFILSKHAEKGAECAQEFKTLELCLWANQETFLEEESKNPIQEATIPKIPAESLKFPPKIVEWSKTKKH